MGRVAAIAVVMSLALFAGVRAAAADVAPVLQAPILRATATRLAGDLRRTRLVLDLSGPVTVRAFVLADPLRVVVDLPAVAFALPADAGRQGRGLVAAYRFGSIGPGRSRVVMDLAQPVAIDRTFVIPGSDDQPTRLVVDLVKTDQASFDRALATGRAALDQPAVAASADQLAAAASTLPVVVIDPGHGGIDAGAKSPSGLQEKGLVLAFAHRLESKLEAAGRYKVLLTRSDDSFISLSERVRIARDAHAALFISIHADTLPDPFGVRGATIYTLSDTASDSAAASYAEKENRSDQNAGLDSMADTDDVADILFELTRRETKTFSNQFAKVLAADFASAATLNKNPHRSAGFRVLTAPDVPSVLLELGYLSNAQDLKLLASDDWGERASAAVAASVDAYFALHGQPAPAAAAPVEAQLPVSPGLPEISPADVTVVRAAVSP